MNPSFGSGSQLLGGTSPLAEAFARRGVDISVLNQQSPASGGFNPSAVPPMAPTGSPAPAAPTGAPQPATMNSMGGISQPDDSQLIIKALIEKLKSDSKIKEAQVSGGF